MGTTKERLQIIIEALNMSRDEMKQLQNDLEGTEQKAKQSKTGLAGMKVSLSALTAVAGSVTAAFYALKKAFDMAEQGAQLELTQRRFERLATSIGTTANVLEEDLNEATAGMLSRFEAMDLAMQLMSLGLAKSHEEAVRLTSIASQLNMDMNQLVLTLTNMTTMRFDALGVAVDGFEDKVRKLEEAGYDTNEAFKLAFMEQSEEQIEKVGSAADTAAGEFAKFTSNIKENKDEFKLWLKDAFLPVVTNMNDYMSAQDRLTEAVEKGIISEGELSDLRYRMRYDNYELADALEYLVQQEEEFAAQAGLTGKAVFDLNQQLRETKKAGEEAGEAGYKTEEGLGRGISALKNFSKEALATALINQRIEAFTVDKFISQEELSRIEYLGEKLGVDLPEDMATMVENYNTLSGNIENLGTGPHREIFGDIFAPGAGGIGERRMEAEFYITKGGETWGEIEDITNRTQEMILKANPTWDPNFDWFFEGVRLMVSGGGVPFRGENMIQDSLREALR